MKLTDLSTAITNLSDNDLMYGVHDGTSYAYPWADIKTAIRTQVVQSFVVMSAEQESDGTYRGIFNVL